MAKTKEISLYGGLETIVFYEDSHKYKKKDSKDWLIGVTSATSMLDKSPALIPWALKVAMGFLQDLIDNGVVVMPNHLEEAKKKPNEKKERAADIGKLIHEWAQNFAIAKRDGLDNPEIPTPEQCGGEENHEKVVAGILGFLKWIEEHDVKILEAEQIVYSRKHDYVGTMDILCTMGIGLKGEKEDHKVLHFGDYKTGGGIYMDMEFQVSGYKGARMEEIETVAKVKGTYPKYFDLLDIGDDFIVRFAKEDKYDKDHNLKEEAGTVEFKAIPPVDSEENFKCFLGLLAVKRRDKIRNKQSNE